MLWDGLNFTDVATKSDCDQLCIDNNCKVANYIGTTDLCFISTTGSQIRNINSNPDLALKGGKCDVCFMLMMESTYFMLLEAKINTDDPDSFCEWLELIL